MQQTQNTNVMYINKTDMHKILFITWYANYLMMDKNPSAANMYVCFHGSTGIGKTAIMNSFGDYFKSVFGKNLFSGIVKLNLSMMDGSDFEMPVSDFNKGEIARLCTINFPDNPVIIQLDELNRYLNTDTVNAMCRVVLDRTGTKKPFKASLVAACANSITDMGTKEYPAHLISRGLHMYLTENTPEAVQANIDYMRNQDYESYMIDAFELSPTTSKDDFEEIAQYEPRTYMFANYILKACRKAQEFFNLDVSEYLIRAMICGVIGCKMGNILMMHRSMSTLPTLSEVINSPDTCIIPDSSIDASLRKKFVQKLIVENGKNKLQATKLITYFARFDSEFARYAIETIAQNCPIIQNDSEYLKFMAQYN